jgi:hypothetical protein
MALSAAEKQSRERLQTEKEIKDLLQQKAIVELLEPAPWMPDEEYQEVFKKWVKELRTYESMVHKYEARRGL